MEVSGTGRGSRKSRVRGGSCDAPRGTPRLIDPAVFQNPADEIGHDGDTALLVGEFCLAFALLDQPIRTLEIMRAGKPGEFLAHTEPDAEAWYQESGRRLTARLNFILGKETRGAQGLAELVRFRNFAYHNPISMVGVGRERHRAAFIHRAVSSLNVNYPKGGHGRGRASTGARSRRHPGADGCWGPLALGI